MAQAFRPVLDAGDLSEAKRIAVAVRNLVHDTSTSTSILSTLNLKSELRFVDTSLEPPVAEPGVLTWTIGLVSRASLAGTGWRCS